MSTTRARTRSLSESLERRTLLATVPAGFVAEAIVTGLSAPTAMEFAPDGRVFITQQAGALRVVKNGALLATPFVSVTTTSSGERGLLGVTFDPNFVTNGYVYVYHTVPGSPAHNRVTRYTADPANPDVALAGSGVPILDLDNLSGATNHNGGAIHFGPDGKLYVAVGENANGANAQSFNNRLGKMLRINADGSTPTDNPFFNTPSVTGLNKQIYALGLRNPFTFSFEPGTGKLHINDVGEVTWEEVNVGQAGANYGWPIIEGVRTSQTPPANYVDPVTVYRHPFAGSIGTEVGIAITGGTFYRRPAAATAPFPDAFEGDYFFADFGSGANGHWIRTLDPGASTSSLFLSAASNPVDLRTGPDGAVYYLERGNGGTLSRTRNTFDMPTDIDLAAASDTGVSSTDNLTNDDTPTITGKATSGAEQRVYVDGVLAATQAGIGNFAITLPTLSEGTHAITVLSATGADVNANRSASTAPITITIDKTAPTVAASFEFETAQEIHLAFSEDVSATLSAGDLTIDPTTPLTFTAGGGAPTVADFTPAGLLADGNYTATMTSSSVTDAAGNALAAAVSLPFFVLGGDANRDRMVDFADLVILAQNYNLAGKTFSQGNFDYSPDGLVEFQDLVILSQKYNTSVLAAAPLTATPTVKGSRKKTENLLV
jgi:glucose/arabinose dehydrogenase